MSKGRPRLVSDELRKANNLASYHAHRAREQYNGWPHERWSGQDWLDLLAECEYHCAYCGQRFPPGQLTPDHKQPLSRYGTNALENIVPACRPCNTQKNDSTPLEFWLRTHVPNGAEILRLRREIHRLQLTADYWEAAEQQGVA